MLLSLSTTELRVLWRNRTAMFTGGLMPLAMGIFWVFVFPADTPGHWAIVVALQLAVVVGMSVYVTATSTITARRHALVLKRLRTSEIQDARLLGGLVAPGVALAIAQLIVLAVVDAAEGAPVPAEPGALVLAVLAGLSLCLTAALATTLITPTPERAQITTMPLLFVLMGGAVALTLPVAALRSGTLPQTLMAVPGANIGRLTALAYSGHTWSIGVAGLPAALPPILAMIAWPLLLGWLSARYFRWEPRR
jgi:ABC-2 type transport system permease protein